MVSDQPAPWWIALTISGLAPQLGQRRIIITIVILVLALVAVFDH